MTEDTPVSRSAAAPSERLLAHVVDARQRDEVEKIVKRWDTPLRAALSDVTRLKLPQNRRAGAVTVEVQDGMSDELAAATEDIEGWQWWLVLHGRLLTQAREGLDSMLRQREALTDHVELKSTDIEAIERARECIEKTLARSIRKDLETRTAAIDDDILGAYWVREQQVCVFWMPVVAFAGIYGVEVQHLAVITLCHELAHAYTHVGLDLNGNTWETDQFCDASDHVKEGLAQYYTEMVLREAEPKLPGVLESFLRLSQMQSSMYNDYQSWFEAIDDQTLEAVRHTMLTARVADAPPSYKRFVSTVKKSHALLTAPVRPKDEAQGRLL